ncbi:MAG: acyltransferase [Bacteroides sp.]|nr:acyltransferase [Prevotella sp.]MCM1407096.1 acyltransferase [Treponema brennaborense]MCM1470248.1 acyltransferase [Bacteroides sp.]
MISGGSEKSALCSDFVPKDNGFHFIRLACCLVVLYEHTAALACPRLLCLNLRSAAVNVFFILSGFWVTQSFLKSESLREYAAKRARKIFPQYAAVVVLCAVLLAAFSALPAKEYFSDGGFRKYLAANLCTLNFLHPPLPGVFGGAAVNGSLWTIKVELAFYVMLPLIVLAARRADTKTHGGVQNRAFSCLRAFGFVRGVYADYS